MTEKKLQEFFSELTEDEISTIENSEINTECDIDSVIYANISAKVQAKTNSVFTQIPVLSAKKKCINKKLKTILIAAVIAIIFAIGTGAAYQFMLPDGLNKELGLNDMHIKTVIDMGIANEDNVKTVQKTVNKNGYTVNFEAIIDGYVILPEITKVLRGVDPAEEIREDRIYAVMTITRDDGKSVLEPDGEMPSCICCNPFFNFNFMPAVKGYAPNSVMFMGTPWFYEENNVLYYLCDITDVAKFADRDLSIILLGEHEGAYGTIVRMDEKGDYYIVDTYDGMGAIFDFDLDDSLADPDAAAKDIAERPYCYVTDPDYTVADELIAKDEAVKKTDLSYAIGNHRWYGWDPLQFGDIPYAETFIELFANKAELAKTDIDTVNQVIEEASAVFEEAYLAEIERIAGKPLEELSNDELNDIAFKTEDSRAELIKIKADFLRENLDFAKTEDGSEYCYIDNNVFLYIPAKSDYAQIVIVYGDRIVISLNCTVDTMNSIFTETMDKNTKTEDTISIVTQYKYYDGTVEVIRK